SRQLLDVQVRRCSSERRAGERRLPGHWLVIQRETQIEIVVDGWNVYCTETDRFVQADRPVGHFDRTNVNGPAGTGALSDTRAALDERSKVPPSIRFFFCDHARAYDTNLADRRAAIDELANAVAQRDTVDADDRPAVARQGNVAQLQAAHERPLQPADAEG